MDELRDLVPRKDPKGGSPRTPSSGIPLRTVQQYSNGNGNGTIWKMATSILAGVNIGLVAAYFTALQSRGVNQREMQEYVDKFSPYSQDKALLAEHNSNQDKEIGILSGHKDRIFDRLQMIESKHIEYEGKFSDLYKKMDTIANYLEEEKKVKR